MSGPAGRSARRPPPLVSATSAPAARRAHQIGEQISERRFHLLRALDGCAHLDAERPLSFGARRLESRGDRLCDGAGGDDGRPLVGLTGAALGGADPLRREDPRVDRAAGRAIDHQVDAAEGVPVGERLDDGDARDAVGDAFVGVAGDDGVDGGAAGGELARDLEDLAVGLAGLEVLGGVEPFADAARVRGGDHHRRAAPVQVRGGGGQRRGQGVHRQPGEVDGQRGARRAGGEDADDPELDPGDLDEDVGNDVGPVRWRAARRLDQVRVEEWELRLLRARAKGPPRILARLLGGRRGADRAEVELVVAERRRGITEDVVRAHDRRPLAGVRGERPLKHVARIEQHDRAAVAGARAAQVGEVPAERRQRLDPAVEIVGAHDGDGDPRGWGRGGDRRRRAPARWRRGRDGRRREERG